MKAISFIGISYAVVAFIILALTVTGHYAPAPVIVATSAWLMGLAVGMWAGMS